MHTPTSHGKVLTSLANGSAAIVWKLPKPLNYEGKEDSYSFTAEWEYQGFYFNRGAWIPAMWTSLGNFRAAPCSDDLDLSDHEGLALAIAAANAITKEEDSQKYKPTGEFDSNEDEEEP